MKSFFIFSLFSIVVLPFFIFESIRFHSLHETCKKIHHENEMLLAGTDCNSFERHQFAKKHKMCLEIEEEQKITPFWCAWHRLWNEGEPLRVWKMFTESYWMLLGLSCFIIYMCFSSWNHTKTLSMQKEMYQETLATVQSLPRLEHHEQNQRHHHHHHHRIGLVPSRVGDMDHRRLA